MKLKYEFSKELSKLTESEDQRKRRDRVARKGASEISRTVIEFAEDMTDSGAQTDKLDHRKVEENMVHVLTDTFEELEDKGYDVADMLDNSHLYNESFGSDTILEGSSYNPTFDAASPKYLVKDKINGEYFERSGYATTKDIQKARLFGNKATATKFIKEKDDEDLVVVTAKVKITEV